MARTYSSNIISALEDGSYHVDDETPTGAMNGANTLFTLAYTPAPATSLEVTLNGQELTLTEDYTLDGDELTLGVAPEDGEILRVDYRVTPET